MYLNANCFSPTSIFVFGAATARHGRAHGCHEGINIMITLRKLCDSSTNALPPTLDGFINLRELPALRLSTLAPTNEIVVKEKCSVPFRSQTYLVNFKYYYVSVAYTPSNWNLFIFFLFSCQRLTHASLSPKIANARKCKRRRETEE